MRPVESLVSHKGERGNCGEFHKLEQPNEVLQRLVGQVLQLRGGVPVESSASIGPHTG